MDIKNVLTNEELESKFLNLCESNRKDDKQAIICIESKFSQPSINGYICTFKTKKIRTEIEGFFEVNQSFNLPTRYTFKIMPSQFHGKVALIIKKK